MLYKPARTEAIAADTPSRPVPTALADVAGFLLHEVAAMIRDRTGEAIRDHRVRPRQLGLLFLLRELGAQSQQHLGERLGMDRTTAMQLVSALEAEGLVARQDDPTDRRAYRVTLTGAGRQITERLATIVADVERQALRMLTAAERRSLNALLRKVLEGPARSSR